MAIFEVKVNAENLEKVKAIVDQLKVENAKLKNQLELVLGVMDIPDVDIPCPSNTGLLDSSEECGILINCSDCWRKVLVQVGDDSQGQLSSPEIAEMHQDGTLCEQCGIYLGGAVGHVRQCAGCEG